METITNDLKEYQRLCKKTARTDFKSPEHEILTWGLGIAGEAADVGSCIKKTYSHGNDQIKGIRENLGDTMWYIATIANFYGWDLQEILEENIEKLKKRYSEGKFTEKHASRGNTMVDWNEK